MEETEFQSPICGADAQSRATAARLAAAEGFNPLFAGLTLKAYGIPLQNSYLFSFNPLFAGLTLKESVKSRSAISVSGFNPLFAGLTLKAGPVG